MRVVANVFEFDRGYVVYFVAQRGEELLLGGDYGGAVGRNDVLFHGYET
jgi:hypothetical protein